MGHEAARPFARDDPRGSRRIATLRVRWNLSPRADCGYGLTTVVFRSAPLTPEPGAAQALAMQHLRAPKITLGTAIDPAQYKKAIAVCNAGPDPHVGETALALMAGDLTAGANCNAAIVTDRRFIARAGTYFMDIPYAEMAQVAGVSGVVLDDIKVYARGQWTKVEGIEAMKPLAAFLQAITQLHPQWRLGAHLPLVTPTLDDPAGVQAARAGLWSRDTRVTSLLAMAEGGLTQGRYPSEHAANLVGRAVMLDRTVAYGRGSSNGLWSSPLAPADLAHAFTRMLGAPVSISPTATGRLFQYRLAGDSGNVAKAAVSTAVGLVALGVLGFGWVSTPGKQLRDVHVHVTPGAVSSGFTLSDGHNPLARDWAALVEKLFDILPRIEARTLLQRAAWGWDAAPEQLDAAPVESLMARVYECAGAGVDLGAFAQG